MSSSKIRSVWIAIGALFVIAVVSTVVALGGGASGGSGKGAVYHSPALGRPGAGANCTDDKRERRLEDAAARRGNGADDRWSTAFRATREETKAGAAGARKHDDNEDRNDPRRRQPCRRRDPSEQRR